MTEARFADKLIFGRTLDEVDEPAVGVIPLLQHLDERQVPLLLRHLGVECPPRLVKSFQKLRSIQGYLYK